MFQALTFTSDSGSWEICEGCSTAALKTGAGESPAEMESSIHGVPGFPLPPTGAVLVDFSSGNLAGKLRRWRTFVKQQCRHFKALGSCAGIPRERFPEGFPRSGAGSGSGSHLSAGGILWKALLRRELGCCPAGLALIFQGRARVRAQPGECPCARGTQVTVLKQNLRFTLEVSLLQAAAPLPVGLTPPLIALGWSQRLPARTWCH